MVADVLSHPFTITVFTLFFGVVQLIVAFVLNRFTLSIDRMNKAIERMSDAISNIQVDHSGTKSTLVEHGRWLQRLDQRCNQFDERCQTRCIAIKRT